MDGGRGKLEAWSQTLGVGGRGMMRAAGGLTLRRGDSGAAAGPSKMVSISVVGLSGGEKEKGSVGSGKSCLCNRFVAPLADDYHVDHISVLSQSDFSGRVLNNDHFLYWGDVIKNNEDGVDFHVQVVEQTEFIDDASFQPFRSGGKQEPYVRRCSETKLVSAEKLMYICKNQLGIEKEFDQRFLPDGRVNVDGFLCVFDVSLVPNRTLEKQVETTAQILNNIVKSKKPVVLVTTKNDEGNEIFIREAERLVNRKEYKGQIPLIETSSHDNINVDLAFFLVASMADRTRGRCRVMSYHDASRGRRDLLDLTTEGFMRLVRGEVQDYGVTWSIAAKKLSQYQEFANYVDLFGLEAAQRMFRRHLKKLKDQYLSEKVARYLDLLPEVLHELFPDISSLGEDCSHLYHWNPPKCLPCRQIQSARIKPWDWVLVQQRIRDHPDFERWFVEYPEDTTWMEADLFDGDSSEHRIPFDVLDSTEAETVYKNLLNQLHAEQKRIELRKDFKQLLEETGYVTPGKRLDEVRVLFMGRECFEALTEPERQHIYDLHQADLIQRCKRNFQELLMEKADLFYQFRSSPAGTVTQDDILDITESLQEDGRYKALDRLDADRKLLLFQHLGFVHCPIREHCPAFPNCSDALVERIVSRRAARPPSWAADSNHLNLVLLGADQLANELVNQIRSRCPDSEFEHGGQVFSLDFRVISGDVDLPQNTFRTPEFLPHGCFCVYSDASSFEYVRSSLEKTLLSNLEQEDRLPFQGLPLVILFQSIASLGEKESLLLREEGQNLADSLQCPFIDVGYEEQVEGNRVVAGVIEDALRSLVESIRHRSGLLNIAPASNSSAPPDLRVIMCMLCGDPYSVEKVLGPLLGHQTCFLSGERSVCVEQQVGDSVKRVEVILSSYHSATDFREELIHGFILVYSTRRRASIATLSAFSINIPELPIQIVAVTEAVGLSSSHLQDLSQALIAEGNNLADRLNAHFMTSTASSQQKSRFYQPFFKEVSDKKAEIEKAFSLDERLSGRLDDSGEGTLERPIRRQPLPPPRIDSYIRAGPPSLNSRSGSGRSGSGSEIYERLPDSGSHGDELEGTGSDDSDMYSHVDSLDREGVRTAPRHNGTNHLPVKPSQIKSRRKQADVSGSRDSLATHDSGWVDDSHIFTGRQPEEEEIWGPNTHYNQGAFTTGRRAARPPGAKPRTQVPIAPGKLNMNDYHNVTSALNKITMTGPGRNAPLAAAEDLEGGYAVPKDTVNLNTASEYAQPMVDHRDHKKQKAKAKNREKVERQRQIADLSETETDSSSDERPPSSRKGGASKRPRKKRVAIPVATPQVPVLPPTPIGAKPIVEPGLTTRVVEPGLTTRVVEPGLTTRVVEPGLTTPVKPAPEPEEKQNRADLSPDKGPEKEASSPRDDHQSMKEKKKVDKEMKSRQKQEKLKKEREDKEREKEERVREKEEKKQREKELKNREKQEAKEKKAQSKAGIKGPSITQNSLEDFRASEDNPIPVFLSMAIEFIEKEGLDAEGLYRVPGNRAHVDLLFQNFEEDKNMDIYSLDIAVNAVATAVKDFFFKKIPPILNPDHMTDLETISVMQDRHMKLLELKKLLERLPRTNYAVLKYIFQHFVRVTERCKENCMDSKNLAICWWPTLLQYEFGDLTKFETMRPHLEDVVQTLIDQFRFVFCGQEEVMMV